MNKPSSIKKTKAVKTTKKINISPLVIEERTTLATSSRSVTSFLLSFCVVVGFILGLFWYGKQAYSSIRVIFSPVRTNRFPSLETQYFDPIELMDVSRRNQIVLIDVRSSQEYQKEHIVGALSYPLYTIQNENIKYIESELLSTDGLDKTKSIVIYGPSNAFQRQQAFVAELKKQGFNIKSLAVGWNELRHFQNIWIPEGLWGKIDVNSIIQKNDIQ
ncbi:MAG: rhodanese-like domain-containing protein [Microgenomates group bacterium]